jgi:predicted DCC family thiol-disulfide oxidoreductase YuxK
MDTEGPLVIFDTDCVLCSGWVHFLLQHERDHELIFVNAWSDTGLALAARHGLDRPALEKTYLVIEKGVGLTRSAAGLALIAHLRPPWSWLRFLGVLPVVMRDAIYDVVARNRYRWFGRKSQCFVPPPDMRHRFIDR